MKVLLDTHALIWSIIKPSRLSRKAAETISDPANDVLISAASAWEIATKVRLGKLPESEPMERRFIEAIEDAGFVLLSIDAAIALRAGRLSAEHRDPFDRIIAAQSLTLDIPVISLDAKLDQFGVRRIW